MLLLVLISILMESQEVMKSDVGGWRWHKFKASCAPLTIPVPILALIAHFWNIININRLTHRASLLLSSKILADNHQHGNCHNRERECRQYRSSDDCITYQCLIALALPHNYACYYGHVHCASFCCKKLCVVWFYDLKFPSPTFYLILVSLLRRYFSLALTVSCCEDKDVKLFCKFLRHIPSVYRCYHLLHVTTPSA